MCRELFAPLETIAAEVPVQKIQWPTLVEKGIECWVRRDDLLPDWCQGNKFYKLYFNLLEAPEKSTFVTFGGPFSNHIHALALAGQRLGRQTVGIIRGEQPETLSPTLVDALQAGMRLKFVSRAQYRALSQAKQDRPWHAQVCDLIGRPDCWVIPEGGQNSAGLRGCEVLGQVIAKFAKEHNIDHVLLAAGTGTTVAGVALGVGAMAQVLGVSVLGAPRQGQVGLAAQVAAMLAEHDPGNWQILQDVGAGRYGYAGIEQRRFMADFERGNGLKLDHVYTGKLFWLVDKLAQQGFWQRGVRLLLIHTGGLQGIRGLDFNK